MGTPKVRYNKATGRWEAVGNATASTQDSTEKDRRERVRGDVAKANGGYQETIEVVDGEKARVLHAPTLKGRMKNNVDALAGEDRFVLSNQEHVSTEGSSNKPTAESVAAEIEALDPELQAIFKQYGGKM